MNWIKHLTLCLPLAFLLIGCAPQEPATTEEAKESVEVAETAATEEADTAPESGEEPAEEAAAE